MTRRNSWIKRIIAAGMTVSLVLSTMAPAWAEEVTEVYSDQEMLEDNFVNSNVVSEDQEAEITSGNLEPAESDSQSDEVEPEETEAQSYEDESTETELQPDDSVSADTENHPESTEDEEVQGQEIQLALELLSEETDDDSRASGLSLTEAIGLSNNLALDEKNSKIINVTDGTGLILLSNVRPSDYCSGYTINLITTVGWNVTKSVEIAGKMYEFLGLGDETNPYSGTFTLDKNTSASQYSITTSRALFNSLSTDAALSNTIPFIISSESSSEKPLLAEKLKKGSSDNKLTCKIVLREPNEGVSDAKIGGLIGTMETDTNADISFENTVNSALTVKGESHTGLFCNTMESGASLTATFTNTNNGKITVEAAANDADAGGFVGHMEDGTLTIAGKSVAQVNSAYGNAGGLVGSANGGAIQIKEEENTNTSFIFADSFALKAGSDKAAGGLIGEYKVVDSETQTGKSAAEYDLSRYQFPADDKEITISGGKNVGGVFGLLQNTGKNASVTLSKNPTNGINVKVSEAVINFGGLIGSYQAENLAGSLAIKGEGDPFIHVVSAGGSKAGSSYGGVIGEVSEKSYVEIENVSVSTADMNSSANTRFGGLVGTVNDGLLNVGSVTLTTNGSDIAVNSVDGRGGLVGYLVKGVLRLHGKTDLSGQKITTAYNHVGQIVGNNGDGLVYATGNGNSLAEDGTGWSLTRYSGADRSGSDIGNWGAVVRLGENLTEGTDGAFTFDTAAHTVTVNNGTGAAISSTNNFVAYALAFDLSNTYKDKNAALRFNNTVDPSASQSVILTGNVDLTGTGVIGIGKDNTEKGVSAQTFTGTFDGGSYTVTLDIGTTYGAGISGSDNAAGQLYAKRSDQQDTHYSLALIPFAKNVTVQNLTIKGNVHCKIPKTVNQEGNETDVRYPAFASGVIGYASGTTTFTSITVNAAVSVTEETEAKKLHAWQSGFLGRFEGTQLTYQNCTWGTDASLTDERSTDNARMGGLAAEVMSGAEVTVKDCILSGTITSNALYNARVGGLIAVSRGETQNGGNLSTISIANLKVNGEKVSAENANVTSGGLLGYQWQNTNVVFASADSTGSSTGVTISGASLTSVKAQFGGLVYQATGYWNATEKDSIVFSAGTDNQATVFNGKSEKNAISGLLVGTGLIRNTVKENNAEKEVVDSALYLEMGTWGSASDAAYRINSKAVTLNISNSEYFDELVGITKDSDFGNTNAVVSLAVRDSNGDAVRIDTNTITTYKGQIQNYKNGQTRYYYNLDSYRKKNSDLNLDSVSTAENLVLWSAAQYAAPNIRGCFRKGDQADVTISGNIDLTGYSYYPVTPIGAVNLGTGIVDTGLTFDYEGIETTETQNKQPSDSDHQHYLMYYGLFYNTSHNIAVKKTSFSGTVGKESSADNTENSNVYNSGVLIFGSVEGDPANNIVEISLNNVTLAGIRVTGVQKENPAYAPLLINRIEQAAKLTVDTLTTGEGYSSGDGAEKTTVYAATSLIGHVGSNTATKLTLSFANIALDGRLHADTGNTTSVYNNGSVSVEYHTTHTIFTRATLLEAFQYSSNGSGTYNFNSTDTLVTYGVELTNTGSTGRNPDKQYQYYDCDSYITDEQNKSANEAYVKERYADSNFIRYVSVQQNITESRYELDINQKTTGLLKGCGTYGDPYIIEDAYQLSSLAAYINGGSTKFQAVFNSKVLEEQKQTADSYHTQDSATEDSMAGTDILYTWENGTWKRDAEDAATIEKDKATKYLLNAYYKINRDITVSAESFAGLGTLTNPFSGVIVGNTQEVTVSVSGTNSNKDSFGGLIAYSRGSVVKDLKVDFSKAAIAMQAESLPGISKNPFFGGVVGYCMGGDTIIDHVSVSYGSNSVSFSGAYEYMIAAGGYVGLVGGATHITENTDYEKTGGGVVFRNMNGTTNSFSTTCSDANAANKTVNMKDVDANNKAGKSTSAGGDYFYRNPYVGRVLDGYACAEDCTVNNTDKNYTIPNLTAGTNDLQVSDASRSLNVTVTSAQGLWLLSAIVNSGAGAMDANGNYTDVDGQVVDAYQSGKPRTASYEGIGTASADDKNLVDEAYWGGWASTAGSDTAKNRVSYLVKNYTTGNAVARLAGKSTSTDTNTPVMLTFETDSIDMSSYGNGFRGIGSSYGNNKHVWNNVCSIPEVYRRNLLIQSINTDRTEDTVITLNMNQNDYHTEYSTGVWRNQGAGLFVDFHFTNGCEVNHLQISGNIKLGLFGAYSKLTYVTKRTNPEVHIGVGGFAARTANSSGTVTFNHFNLKDINVYGGTMTGGAIGYIDGYSGAGRNVSFTNWTIQNEKVTKWVYDDGSTGGLVGWNIGYGTLSITGNEDSSVKDVDQLSVTTHAESFNTAAAGGLVGANDYSSVKVENVNAQNLSVSGKNLRDLGGLLAAGRKGGMLEVKKCSLASMKITLEINSSQRSLSACAGGIIGFHERPLTISEVMIVSDSTINGQQFTGGFVGYSAVDVTIRDCREENINIKTAMNWIGGFIGYVNPNRTATFQNCLEENVNILGRYTGGLVGAVDGSITASNMTLERVMVITNGNASSYYAGLLTGNSANNGKSTNKVLGYNILAKDCKAGYSNVSDFNKLAAATIQSSDTTGLWLGNNGKTTKTNLTAVSAGGDVFPQKDIGTQSGVATIIYADKTADQTYRPTESTAKPSPSEAPWVDVNPKGDVPFADGTVMTGNGIGMSTDVPVAKSILQRFSSTDADRYWNLTESDNATDVTYRRFSQFLDTSNEAYITTYRTEESSTTEISADIDFPVLVVNNSAEVDTMLWNYIAAMTNVESGTKAKTQVKSITATTYKWDSKANNFAAQTTGSLNVSTTKKISIVPNAYDNMSSQFTLLDVTYANPTNGEAEPFHLYIPVLVKKVLYIWFKTRFIAGTDYCASDYPMDDDKTNHYATAGFDEPLTAYIEYTYDQDTDWQSMLDNGENLLWSYDKILDLAYNSTGTLPKGTQLTLVDRQTKQYYTYTMSGNEDVHNFNLSQMQTPDGKLFTPVDICDLLGLTVSGPVTDETEGAAYYVRETDKENATVRVGTEYFRKATEADTNEPKYRITAAENREARIEGYYLTVQIPATAGVAMVNNRLNYAPLSRKEGTLPASVKTKTVNGISTSSSGYPIYQGVEQTLTVSTSRIHNGSDMGSDTVMENGDSIKITLESKLKLTEAGKDQFSKVGPAEVYHQFDISLKKYLTDINGDYSVIGTEMVDYTYTLSGQEWTKTLSGRIQDAAGQEMVTIRYGGSDLKKALESAENDETAVKVTAVITLTYATADYFPERNTSNSNDNSGISAIAASRIANTESQLPITSTKRSQEGEKRYYITNRSQASLTYSAVDRTGVGDTTQQLGINPSDEENSSDMIYTRGDYDYSNVDADTLTTAKSIRYSLELFRKNDNGVYDETTSLSMKDYLQNLYIQNHEVTDSKTESCQWTEEFTANETKHVFTNISFVPLTGDAFEKAGYTYANYKVRLTAVLLNSNGEELADTKTSDYIIYTNARIYQEMIAVLQGAAANNVDSETKAG
ncbi:hypothetical protein [Jingyaoa shaoxingensis]|uniref:Uncharacterized protein n=1 Tax=Jingyaoa shaoxingensis TaxID=2763671 RepID=A0ABR7N8U7_9FIRM|nr:hypothetical protein [Jingyaoa shaoxingensis]MBC8572822.1 hypothetical protein [Jingyaoa shaoxingensis]